MFKELTDFWFSDEAKPLWFNSTPEFDNLLCEKYEDLWQRGTTAPDPQPCAAARSIRL